MFMLWSMASKRSKVFLALTATEGQPLPVVEDVQRSARRMLMKNRSLTASQLAHVDLIITRAQENGRFAQDLVRYTEDTEGVADAHHPFFDFSEHDLSLIAQIQSLAQRLEAKVRLGKLIELRGEAVRNLKRG
jgi:hypothetical protein